MLPLVNEAESRVHIARLVVDVIGNLGVEALFLLQVSIP